MSKRLFYVDRHALGFQEFNQSVDSHAPCRLQGRKHVQDYDSVHWWCCFWEYLAQYFGAKILQYRGIY